MARPALLCALVLACSHAARKDLTPALAAEAPEAAAQEAAAPGAPPLTAPEMIEHILSRTTFGARPEDRLRAQSVGIAAFVEEQLHPERLDDALLEQKLQRFDLLREGPDALVQKLVEQRQMRKRAAMVEDAPPPPDGGEPQEPMRNGSLKRDAISQLAQAKLMRAVFSRRQLQEVMTDFWFNHFNVFAGKQEEAALLPDYEQNVIRAHALGSFPELLEATAHSPAMLIYLDNWRSAVPRPGAKQNRGINENYARELLELHTLGVDGGYTQEDVVEVARCFTGWTVAEPRTNPHFVFRPAVHDFGSKVVLGRLIPPGRGEEDAKQVLHVLAAHPATARFIAQKLARRFVSDAGIGGRVTARSRCGSGRSAGPREGGGAHRRAALCGAGPDRLSRPGPDLAHLRSAPRPHRLWSSTRERKGAWHASRSGATAGRHRGRDGAEGRSAARRNGAFGEDARLHPRGAAPISRSARSGARARRGTAARRSRAAEEMR